MLVRRKYQLPSIAPIPGKAFDVEKLKQEVVRLNKEWVSVFQANRGLCSNHLTLAESNYEHFSQINLTYFEPSLNDVLDIDDLKKECKVQANSLMEGERMTLKYRTKVNRDKKLPPAMNEHNWYHPLPLYKDSYIKEAIESQFEATPIRVRLTRIAAGKFLTPHIDYDPTYAVRVIVPVQGTQGVVNKIWRKNVEESYEMPADGRAYFLNTGLKHAVEHRGTEDRIALMFSLPNQKDIQDLEYLEHQNSN